MKTFFICQTQWKYDIKQRSVSTSRWQTMPWHSIRNRLFSIDRHLAVFSWLYLPLSLYIERAGEGHRWAGCLLPGKPGGLVSLCDRLNVSNSWGGNRFNRLWCHNSYQHGTYFLLPAKLPVTASSEVSPLLLENPHLFCFDSGSEPSGCVWTWCFEWMCDGQLG